MAMQPHLTEEEIAFLVEGSLNDSDKRKAYEHLRSCKQCFEDYKDAAMGHGIWTTERNFFGKYPELVSAGLKIAENEFSQRNQSSEDAVQSKPFWGILRPLAVAVCAVLLIAAAVWIPGRVGHKTALPEESEEIQTILAVAEKASSNSEIVFPGTEDAFDPDLPVYRSGMEYDEQLLSSSLNTLVERAKKSPADRNDLFWLATGFLADGQLSSAKKYIDIALAEYPDDRELAVLNALIFYLDENLEEAERLLNDAHQTDPGYAVAHFNLCVVLLKMDKTSEARELLKELQKRHPKTPLAKRAGKLLAKS